MTPGRIVRALLVPGLPAIVPLAPAPAAAATDPLVQASAYADQSVWS